MRYLFFFLVSCSLYGNSLPHKISTQGDQKHAAFSSPFNNAPEFGIVISYLKYHFKIKAAVETGTFKANTTLFLAHIFDEVYTIEINEDLYNESFLKLVNYPNAHCYLGSSEAVMRNILPDLSGKRTLFYLDAHWQDHWPLLEEIEEIGRTHRDNCIIVIDDFKVPGKKNIPYDSYGNNECSYNYIKDKLNLAFSNYTHHYILPKKPGCRAKFLAIPVQWADEQ